MIEKYEVRFDEQLARAEVMNGRVRLVIGKEVYTLRNYHARELGAQLRAAARCADDDPTFCPNGRDVLVNGPIFTPVASAEPEPVIERPTKEIVMEPNPEAGATERRSR